VVVVLLRHLLFVVVLLSTRVACLSCCWWCWAYCSVLAVPSSTHCSQVVVASLSLSLSLAVCVCVGLSLYVMSMEISIRSDIDIDSNVERSGADRSLQSTSSTSTVSSSSTLSQSLLLLPCHDASPSSITQPPSTMPTPLATTSTANGPNSNDDDDVDDDDGDDDSSTSPNTSSSGVDIRGEAVGKGFLAFLSPSDVTRLSTASTAMPRSASVTFSSSPSPSTPPPPQLSTTATATTAQLSPQLQLQQQQSHAQHIATIPVSASSPALFDMTQSTSSPPSSPKRGGGSVLTRAVSLLSDRLSESVLQLGLSDLDHSPVVAAEPLAGMWCCFVTTAYHHIVQDDVHIYYSYISLSLSLSVSVCVVVVVVVVRVVVVRVVVEDLCCWWLEVTLYHTWRVYETDAGQTLLWVRSKTQPSTTNRKNDSLSSRAKSLATVGTRNRSSSKSSESLSKISRMALRSIGIRATDQIKHVNAESISSSLSASEVFKIYRQMSHPHRGVPIKERISSSWSVESAFDGSSAITWLCDNVSKLKIRDASDRSAARLRALHVCQRLIKDGFMYHVNHDQNFEDQANLYYCFASDEDRAREFGFTHRSAELRPVDNYALLAAVCCSPANRPNRHRSCMSQRE
jgi:hypothetical protein